MNRQFTLNLVRVALVVGVIVMAVGQALSWPAEAGRERLRNVLAQALAEQLDREVQVGELGGNLLTGLYLTHLAIAREGGFEEGVEIAAGRLELDYDLLAVLRGQVAAPASLRMIRVDRLYAWVDLSEEGEVSLEDLVKPGPPTKVPPEERFQPLILVQDAVIDLHARLPEGPELSVRLTDVRARVKINPVGPLEARVSARGGYGVFGTLVADILSYDEEGALLIRGEVTGVPLGHWVSALRLDLPAEVTSGRADARFQFWSVPQGGNVVGPIVELLAEDEEPPELEKEIGFYAEVDLRGVGLRLPQIGNEAVTLPWVRAAVSPEGVRLDYLRGGFQGAQLHAEGWVYNLKSPVADLRLQVSELGLDTVRRLLPEDLAAELPEQITGLAELAADVTGPVAHLDARVDLRLPDLTASDVRFGTVSLADFHLAAEIWDTGEPVVSAAVSAESLTPPADLGQVLHLAGADESDAASELEITMGEATGLRGRMVWTGGSPLAELDIGALSASVGGVGLEGMAVQLTLAGHSLRAHGLQADLLGGRAVLEAFVYLPPTPDTSLRAVANVRLADLDLTRLPAALTEHLGEEVAGTVSSELTFTWEDKRGKGAARVDLMNARYGEHKLETVQALALVEASADGDWQVEVPLARAIGPGLNAWVHAHVGRDQPWQLVADLGGLDLQALPLGEAAVAGRAYGQVQMSGSLADPVIAGEIILFDARYQDYELGALVASFEARPEDLQAKSFLPPAQGQVQVYASYDTAIAQLELALSPPGELEFAPRVDGDLRLTGVRARRLQELFPKHLPPDAEIRGLARLSLKLGGSTLEPWAEGHVIANDLQYEDYFVDVVELPVRAELAPEDEVYVRIKNGTVLAQGATVTIDGRVMDVFDEWRAEVEARASGVHLERLHVVREHDLPLAGQVLVPRVRLQASSAGVSGEGWLVAEEVRVDGSNVGSVDTHFLVERNQVRLERTAFRVAEGEIVAELTYGLDTRELEGAVSLSRVRTSPLLRLAAPLAATAVASGGGDGAEMSRILRRWSVRSQGTLQAQVEMAGPVDALAGKLSFKLDEAEYLVRVLPEAQGTLAFDLAGPSVQDVDVELWMGDASMFVKGSAQSGGRIAIVADASSVNLALLDEWLPLDLDVGGVAGVTIVAQGELASPEVTASVDVLSPSVRGVKFDLISVPVVRVAEGGVDVERIVLKRGEREILGYGHLPFSWQPLGVPVDQSVSFLARIEKTDLGFFPPLLDEFLRGADQERPATVWTELVASGEVNSELALTGTLDRPVLRGFLRLDEGRVAHQRWPHPITGINVDVTARGRPGANTVEVSKLAGKWDQVAFSLEGDMDLSRFRPAEWEDNRFDLRLALEAPSQQFWPGAPLRDIGGMVKLVTQAPGRQRLSFEQVGAKAGTGAVRLNGEVQLTSFLLRDLARNAFELELDLEKPVIEYGTLFRGEVNGKLQVHNPRPGVPAELAGVLVVRQANLGLPPAGAGDGPLVLVAPGPESPDFGVDVRVEIGENVRLRTPGLIAPIKRNREALVAGGSLQAPTVWGRVEAEEVTTRVPGGELVLRYAGMSYRVQPAPGEFRPPRRLDIGGNYFGQAEQMISDAHVDGVSLGQVRVLLDIGGDVPERPTISVSSDPPLTVDQIVRLMGMQPFVGPGTVDLSQVLSERFVSLLATGFREMLLTPIEEELRRTLGLSEFSLNLAFDEPMELRMGKYLVRNLRLTYRIKAIGDAREQWELGLSYELPYRFRVSYTTNERGEARFQIGHTWTF